MKKNCVSRNTRPWQIMAGWVLVIGLVIPAGPVMAGDENATGDRRHAVDVISIQQGSGKASLKLAARSDTTIAAAKVSPKELLSWARQASRASGYRANTNRIQAPGGARSDQATSRLITQGKRLNQEILRAGSRMSQEQADRYLARMKQLVEQMDRKGKCQAKIGKEGPAKCMCNCDKAYPGFGGGNGWNRFWCKTSCLVAKTVGN